MNSKIYAIGIATIVLQVIMTLAMIYVVIEVHSISNTSWSGQDSAYHADQDIQQTDNDVQSLSDKVDNICMNISGC